MRGEACGFFEGVARQFEAAGGGSPEEAVEGVQGHFMPRSPIWYEAHMCLLPAAWGDQSREISLACARWFATESGCRKLTATVPQYNRLMHALASRIGMQRIGVLTESTLQGGRLCDQTIFGLSI